MFKTLKKYQTSILIFSLLLLGILSLFQSETELDVTNSSTVSSAKKTVVKKDSNWNKISKTPAKKKQQRIPSAIKPKTKKTYTNITIEDFKKKYPGNWNIRRNQDSSIHSISGGLINEPKENIFNLANELKPLLAYGDFQLKKSSNSLSKTDYISTESFEQSAEGFAVYQGSVDFFTRNSDDSVYLINNQLKEVTPFDPKPVLSIQEALQVLQVRLPKYHHEQKSSSPILFALNGQNSQLAWVFYSSLNNTKNDSNNHQQHSQKEIVVSAVDGEVLHQEELVIAD